MKKFSHFNWLYLVFAFFVAVVLCIAAFGMYNSAKRPAPAGPAAVSMRHGVTLTTTYRGADYPELHVSVRQKGPFNIGITAKMQSAKHEEPFIGMGSMEVVPISPDNFYRIRVLVPSIGQRPRVVFDEEVMYSEASKRYVFR
jgi:hypothetical protein